MSEVQGLTRRISGVSWAPVLLLAGALALSAGVAAGLAPVPALAVGIGAAVLCAVAVRPVLAAYILLATTPLLVGIGRGAALPLLRPSEAISLLLAVALALRLVVTRRLASRGQAAARPTRVDAAIVLLAVTSSVLPLLWMTVRGRSITHDDILYALVLWKFYAIFLIVRVSVRTEREVARCLVVVVAASALAGLIGILQSEGVGSVSGFLNHYYSSTGQDVPTSGRASSTMGSSFSVADVMTYCLAIVVGWLIRGGRHRVWLSALSILFVVATVAAGEFSALIGLVVAAFAIGLLLRRFGRTMLGATVGAIGAILLLQPVIQARLASIDPSSGLPASWTDRLNNLRTFFWPQLRSDYNWLTGVRPTARVSDSHIRGGFVWIESGHTWLLWTGGLAMLIAFFVFLGMSIPAVARVARARSDAVGVAAVGSFTSLIVMAVLMTFDPHLTLRGAADLSFSLLALALVDVLPRTAARISPMPRGHVVVRRGRSGSAVPSAAAHATGLSVPP